MGIGILVCWKNPVQENHPQVISILMVETTPSRGGRFMAGFPTQTHLFGLRCRAGSSQKATDATLGYRQNASFDDILTSAMFDLFGGRKLSGEKALMVLAARVKPCSRLGFFVNEHIHRKTMSKAQLYAEGSGDAP